MKKLILMLCAGCALSASATVPKLEVTGDLEIIPPFATANGESILTAQADGQITAYNSNLDVLATVNVPGDRTVTLNRWYQSREYVYQDDDYGPFGDWGERREAKEDYIIPGVSDIVFRHNCIDYNDATLTQTLFNSDNRFEYVVPKTKVIQETWESETQRGGGDVVIVTGFSIMSDNGSKLYDIDFPQEYQEGRGGSSIEVYILGEKKYLFSDFYQRDQNEYISLFFEIESDGKGGVKAPKVVKSQLKVNPAASRRGDTVNIDLGKPAAAPTTLSVVSAAGAIVRRLSVPAGQSGVALSTDGLASGLYIVAGNDGDVAKIIIR